MSPTTHRSPGIVATAAVALALISMLTLAACDERRAVGGGIKLLLEVLTSGERSEQERRQRHCELIGKDCEAERRKPYPAEQ